MTSWKEYPFTHIPHPPSPPTSQKPSPPHSFPTTTFMPHNHTPNARFTAFAPTSAAHPQSRNGRLVAWCYVVWSLRGDGIRQRPSVLDFLTYRAHPHHPLIFPPPTPPQRLDFAWKPQPQRAQNISSSLQANMAKNLDRAAFQVHETRNFTLMTPEIHSREKRLNCTVFLFTIENPAP